MRSMHTDIRPWHYIQPNKRTSTPTSCLFVDTETSGVPLDHSPDTTLQVLRLWCAHHVRLEKGQVKTCTQHQGYHAGAFWLLVDELLNDKRPLWLFAHNIGFDLTVLNFWKLLDEGDYTLGDQGGEPCLEWDIKHPPRWRGMAVLDDPPVIIECRRTATKKTLLCVDTFNFFRESAAALGESIGIPKTAMPDEQAPVDDWFAYCHNDVTIIRQAIVGLMRFVQCNDLGKWGMTAPSQAYAAYRHRFMEQRIVVHGNVETLKLEREAYYGGRVECRFVGKVASEYDDVAAYFGQQGEPGHNVLCGPVHVLDIQSCYPSMMLWHPYPRAVNDVMVMPSLSELDEWMDDYCCIARVEINSPTDAYPYRNEGRTILATGKFVTSLCGPELEHAFSHGNINSIGLLAVYHPADLFSKYVATFWNMRTAAEREGDKVKSSWCKLMLNSLAGKFGQRSRTWEPCDTVEAPMPWGTWSQHNKITGENRSYRALAWNVQEEQDRGETLDSCPSIAAYVTSYARERLRELIGIAGEKNVYYCDTDSLHVSDNGLANLKIKQMVQDGTIGMLRIVGTYDTADYRGVKDYTLDGVRHVAGIKANAVEIATNQYKQDQFEKLRCILDGPPRAGVKVKRVTIDRRCGLDPLRIGSDGWVKSQVVGV